MAHDWYSNGWVKQSQKWNIYVTSQNLVQGISVGQKIESCCPKSKGWDLFCTAFIIGKKKEIGMEWKDGAKAEEIWGERSNRGRRWWTGIAGTVVTVGPGPALGHQTPPGHGCSSQHSSPQLWHAESHIQLPSGASPSPHPMHNSHICSLCSCPWPAVSSLPAAPVRGRREEKRKAGGGRGAPPLIFDKEPAAPEAANKASSTLCNIMQLIQEDILKKELKGHKRRWLLWDRKLQNANSSCMSLPRLSSRSSPIIAVSPQGLEFSSQCSSGQLVMPIFLMKHSARWYKFLPTCSLQNSILSKVICWEGKSSNRKSFSLHWECVCVCVCKQVKEAARPVAFPVLKQTFPSYDLFGRSILRLLITEQVADIFWGEGKMKHAMQIKQNKPLDSYFSTFVPNFNVMYQVWKCWPKHLIDPHFQVSNTYSMKLRPLKCM